MIFCSFFSIRRQGARPRRNEWAPKAPTDKPATTLSGVLKVFISHALVIYGKERILAVNFCAPTKERRIIASQKRKKSELSETQTLLLRFVTYRHARRRRRPSIDYDDGRRSSRDASSRVGWHRLGPETPARLPELRKSASRFCVS